MILPSGGLAYVPATLKTHFSTVVSFKHPDSPFWIKRNRACLTILLMIRQFRKISNFELWPGKGVQYARSAGSGKSYEWDVSDTLQWYTSFGCT